MTQPKNRKGRALCATRPPECVQLGGFEQNENSPKFEAPQGGRPLYFEPVCRQEAVRTAEAFNDAAARLKAAALSNAGNLGRSLDALAGHYAKRAASYFIAADTLPEVRA